MNGLFLKVQEQLVYKKEKHELDLTLSHAIETQEDQR